MPHAARQFGRQLHLRSWGHVGLDDLVGFIRQHQATEDFPELRGVLHDFSDLQSLAGSRMAAELLAANDIGAALTNPRLKLALVGTHPDLRLTVEQYLGQSRPGLRVRLFDTVAEAQAWLDGDG